MCMFDRDDIHLIGIDQILRAMKGARIFPHFLRVWNDGGLKPRLGKAKDNSNMQRRTEIMIGEYCGNTRFHETKISDSMSVQRDCCHSSRNDKNSLPGIRLRMSFERACILISHPAVQSLIPRCGEKILAWSPPHRHNYE